MREIKPKEIKRYELSRADMSKPQKKWPSISVDLYALPEAKNWDVDEEYTVTFKLKMTGINMRKSNNPNDYDMDYGNNATFNIVGVEAKDTKKSKDDTTDE